MASTMRTVLTVAGAAAVIASGLTVASGTALAAPPKCTAVLKSGFGCLAVDNRTKAPSEVYSIRIDKTCITGLVPGKTRYATGYAIEANYGPHQWMWNTGGACEGGTESAIIARLSGWSGVDKNGYVTVTMVTAS